MKCWSLVLVLNISKLTYRPAFWHFFILVVACLVYRVCMAGQSIWSKLKWRRLREIAVSVCGVNDWEEKAKSHVSLLIVLNSFNASFTMNLIYSFHLINFYPHIVFCFFHFLFPQTPVAGKFKTQYFSFQIQWYESC